MIETSPLNVTSLKTRYAMPQVQAKGLTSIALLKLTVAKLANNKQVSAREYLSGHSLEEISEAIKTNAKNEQDVTLIIELVTGHANQLIGRYADEGKDISFEELLAVKRSKPDSSVAICFSYVLATKDPNLATHADKLLNKQTRYVDPHIQYNPLHQQITFLNKNDLATTVFETSNQQDKEFQESIDKSNEQNKAEARLQNYKRLANMQIELKQEMVSPEEVVMQKYRQSLLIRT